MSEFEDIENEHLPAFLRKNLETRVRDIVPDVGDKVSDTLAAKVKTLKDELSKSEMNAFYRFKEPANHHIHGYQDIDDETREKLIKDYHKINEGLDKINIWSNNSESYSRPQSEWVTNYATSSGNEASFIEKVLYLPIATLEIGLAGKFDPVMVIIGVLLGAAYIYLIFYWIMPLFLVVSSIILLAIGLFISKHRVYFLLSCICAGVYTFFTYKSDWYAFEMLSYFPTMANYFPILFALNIVSASAALYLVGKQIFVNEQAEFYFWDTVNILVVSVLSISAALVIYLKLNNNI